MAAFGTTYVTLQEAKSYIMKEHAGVTDTARDARIQMALNAATESVNNHCERQFNRQEDATPRVYTPLGGRLLVVDDFWSGDDLVIQSGDLSWGWGNNWPSTQYKLEPANGVVNGVPGWPYRRITLSRYSPDLLPGAEVRATAKWGWPEVPAPVKQATLIMTAELFKLEDAPLGVEGFKDFGVHKVASLPQVCTLLCDYKIGQLRVG